MMIVNETKFVNFPVSGMEAKFTDLTVEELISKYTGLLKTIAYTMAKTYHLTREDQEDLISAVRFRLFTNYGKIDFTRPEAPGYIKAMITNTARTELGKILRHRTNVIRLDDFPDDDAGDENDAGLPFAQEVSLDTISQKATCGEVMATLSSKHRKMVEMYMAGITTKEIAERVTHKNGRPYTAPSVAWIIAEFRRKVQARVKS